MGRVVGDTGAIASSTNACGTGLRCLTAKRVSSSGSGAVLLRDFDIRAEIVFRSLLLSLTLYHWTVRERIRKACRCPLRSCKVLGQGSILFFGRWNEIQPCSVGVFLRVFLYQLFLGASRACCCAEDSCHPRRTSAGREDWQDACQPNHHHSG